MKLVYSNRLGAPSATYDIEYSMAEKLHNKKKPFQ